VRRVPVVLQATRFDCGPACLAALLAAFGRAVPMAVLRERLDPGRDGISALELRDEARHQGLGCRGRRVEPRAEALAQLPRPFLAHWEGDHYIVVTRVGTRRIEVMDPAIGRRRLTHADYLTGATGVVLTFDGPPAPPPPTDDRRPHPVRVGGSPLRSIVRPAVLANPGALAILGLTSLLLLAVGLVVPKLTAQAVDTFVAAHNGSARRFGPLVGPVTGVVLAAGVLTLARGLATVLLQRRIGESLTGAFVARLLAAPLQFVERRGPGELAARIQSADGLRDALATRLVGAMLDTVVGPVYLVVVAVAEPRLGLATAVLAGVQLAVLGGLAIRGRRLRREELLAQARSSSWLLEVTTGLAWVKGAGAERIVERRVDELRARQLTALHRAGRNDAVAEAIASAVRIAGPLVLLIVAASSATVTLGPAGAGPAAPGLGTGRVVALAALAAAALVPLGSIASHLRDLSEIGSVLDHLQDLAEAPVESAPGRQVVDRLSGAVTASGLGFRFTQRGRWIVEDVSFDLPPGAKLAIVGPSGSGKSTLARLLVGLYRPTAGSVALDGVDLDTLDLSSVRRLLGVVWQDPLIFSGTVHENLTLRVPHASPAAVAEAARVAAIDDDIRAMPMGYATRLGPSGEGLSGGQRQRLALARALVDRPAVLVLDEATSHLDTPTEALVEQNLRSAGVTRIVIAHRLSTVHDADHILVLVDGRIVEQGTHHALLAHGGAYARMVKAQAWTA
jgi:ABC-type bacteriocin/lantibiotic exporter with double-glycine peptidase domain